MRIRATTATMLAAGVLVTGCSSSSDTKPDAKPSTAAPTTAPVDAPSTTPTAAVSDDKTAVTAAAQAYTKAYFTPDADGVYALLSARCQRTTSVSQLTDILVASAVAYGKPTVKSTEVNQLSGDMARVTVHYVTPPMPETPQPWTREQGQWRFDGCA
jgi:PBP1b-binding outer membrane lipoprotein LpoB